MGATILRTPELALTEGETARLSEAILRVADLYEIPMLGERAVAWLALASTAGQIYGPRVIAVHLRRKEHRGSRSSSVEGAHPANHESARPESVPPPVARPVSQPIDFSKWNAQSAPVREVE